MSTKKLDHFILPEHYNELYTKEAISSISLTRDIADKINELVDIYNSLDAGDLAWKQEIEGTVRKAVVFMKDNLLNSLNGIMVTFRDSGFIDDRIKYHCNNLKDDFETMNGRLDNLLGAVKEGTTSMDAEIIDARTDVNGRVYGSIGSAIREQLTTLPIGKKAIEEGDSLDMNSYTSAGNYVLTVYDGLTNIPKLEGYTARYLKVECFGQKIYSLGNIQTWGKQILYTEDGEKAFKRYFKWNYQENDFVFGNWRNENHLVNFTTVTEGDMNNIVEPGEYIIATAELPNMAYWGGGLLTVRNYSYGWIVQEVYGLPHQREHWYRIGNNTNQVVHTNNAEGLTVNWSQWEKVLTEANVETTIKNAIGSVNTTFTNRGYTIVNMGDSLFGNFRDATSISNYLANSTGATVHNCGFGGCRMSGHYAPWSAFSMYKLADAIVTGDFTEQEANATHSDAPEYFVETVNLLKSIDFSTVDIITINYGVNDFTSGQGLASDTFNFDTYEGSLKYSIEKILAKYPNIRIVLVTPCFSYWLENGAYSKDSDTYTIAGRKLTAFVDKCKEVAGKYHLPVVDTYNELGVNKFNCTHYSNDGIHPTEDGRKAIAKLMSKTIAGM